MLLSLLSLHHCRFLIVSLFIILRCNRANVPLAIAIRTGSIQITGAYSFSFQGRNDPDVPLFEDFYLCLQTVFQDNHSFSDPLHSRFRAVEALCGGQMCGLHSGAPTSASVNQNGFLCHAQSLSLGTRPHPDSFPISCSISVLVFIGHHDIHDSIYDSCTSRKCFMCKHFVVKLCGKHGLAS